MIADRDIQSLRVKEMFPTIQGEGPFAGEPCVFLRLEGCNLKCWFCDTDFDDGAAMVLPQIIESLEAMSPEMSNPNKRKLCVITGGEPFAQDIGLLVTSLLGRRWSVQIETAGTLWVDLPEDKHLSIVVSPKTAKVHPKIRLRASAWKYLVRDRDRFDPTDGLPVAQTQDNRKAGGYDQRDTLPVPLAKPSDHVPVFLQPVEELDDPEACQLNLNTTVRRCMEFGHRLSLQQHKVLGLP